MKTLFGFGLCCVCACAQPRVPSTPQSIPPGQASAPAASAQQAPSPTPVPGMPPWLAGKLPPNRLPSADNAFRDIPEGPQVAITQQQVLVDGEVVAMTLELQRADRLQKVEALFQYLKAHRERVKAAQPADPFPGVVSFWVDMETSALVLKSAFQTAAFAGFPNGFFVVRDRGGTGFKTLPIDALYPPSGRLPPEVIQGIVRSNYARVRECYEAGLARKADLAGKVQVRFVIERDGSVRNATLESSTLPDNEVNQCVLGVFSSLRFPEPQGGIVTVVYPLLLEPAEASR